MSVSDVRIFVDNKTKEITVDFDIGDTVVSHPLEESEFLYKMIEDSALTQYMKHLKLQLEEARREVRDE